MSSAYFAQMLPLEFTEGAAQAPVVPGRVEIWWSRAASVFSFAMLVWLGEHAA